MKMTLLTIFFLFAVLFGHIESARSTVTNFSGDAYPWWDVKGDISQKDLQDIQDVANKLLPLVRLQSEFEAEREKFLKSKGLTHPPVGFDVARIVPLAKGGLTTGSAQRPGIAEASSTATSQGLMGGRMSVAGPPGCCGYREGGTLTGAAACGR